MRELEKNIFLVETVNDLETVRKLLSGQQIGFLDLETTSRNPKLTSLNPWHTCWIAGFAITAGLDRQFPSFYLPVGHEVTLFDSVNLPMAAVLDCLQQISASWVLWVNASIKYDMHCMDLQLGWIPDCEVEDIQTVAKLHNTDRFNYNQTVLAEEYAGYSIKRYEDSLEPYKVDNKDYGRIPVEVMCPYACMDVVSVRDAWQALNSLLDPELDHVRKMERAVLRVLFDCERVGLTVNPTDIRVQRICVGHEILMRSDRLAEEIGFPGFNTGSPKMMNEYFTNRLGLPVVKWTNENDDDPDAVHNPSYGKEALTEYLVHPRAPTAIVKEVIELKKLKKFHSAFLEPYDEKSVDGNIHCNYNPLVRTGRMACKDPNTMQLNTIAKTLIVPKPGCSFLSVDLSQVEFRIIVHYIKDKKCLDAYAANPDQDYHQWLAELAKISRKQAKTANFLQAFGGGKEKLLLSLVKDPTLVEGIKEQADRMKSDGAPMEQVEQFFNMRAMQLAVGVYDAYHKALPSLKRTSYAVSDAARSQGFVRTLYKRRRHLRPERSHIAFNSAVQGTAADCFKQAVSRLPAVCAQAGVTINALVHDSILFEGPHKEIESEEFLRAVLSIVEVPEPIVPLTVPIRASYGYSRNNWAEADGDSKVYPISKSDWQRKKG